MSIVHFFEYQKKKKQKIIGNENLIIFFKIGNIYTYKENEHTYTNSHIK